MRVRVCVCVCVYRVDIRGGGSGIDVNQEEETHGRRIGVPEMGGGAAGDRPAPKAFPESQDGVATISLGRLPAPLSCRG